MAKMPTYLIDALVIVSICEQLAVALEARADDSMKWLEKNPNFPDMHDASVRINTIRWAARYIRESVTSITRSTLTKNHE